MSKLTKLYRAATAAQVALEQRTAEETAAAAAAAEAVANEEAAAASEQAPPVVEEPSLETYHQVQDVARLVETVASAEEARDVVHEVRDVQLGVEDLRDVAGAVNEAGGFTQESLAFATLALEQQSRRLGIKLPNLGVGLESFPDKNTRLLVNLEAVDELIASIKTGGVELEKRSVEAATAVYDALTESMPAARERLDSVLSGMENATIPEGAQVDTSDGIAQFLAVDGKIPDDWAGYVTQYAAFGTALTSEYNEAALDAAQKAAKFNADLNFESAEAFWKSVGEAIDTVGDPRSQLTADQLAFSLPGAGPLFGGETCDYAGDNPVIKALKMFAENRAPLDPLDPSERADDATAASASALTVTAIEAAGKALCDLHETINVSNLLDRGKATWSDAVNAVRQTKAHLDDAPATLQAEICDDVPVITEYLDAVYCLSNWPVMHFLTNLVFVTNAFVLYAQRSLCAEAETASLPDDTADGGESGEDGEAAAAVVDTTDTGGDEEAAATDTGADAGDADGVAEAEMDAAAASVDQATAAAVGESTDGAAEAGESADNAEAAASAAAADALADAGAAAAAEVDAAQQVADAEIDAAVEKPAEGEGEATSTSEEEEEEEEEEEQSAEGEGEGEGKPA